MTNLHHPKKINFSGPVWFVFVIILIVSLFFGFSWTRQVINGWLDDLHIKSLVSVSPSDSTNIETESEVKKADLPISAKNLIDASFSDTFSGTAWLDMGQTNLYHDRQATALTLDPVFKLTGVNTTITYTNPTCSGFCTSSDKKRLIWNGKELVLPGGTKDLSEIYTFEKEDLKILGVVRFKDGLYSGELYSFDGKTFSSLVGVSNPIFISKYPGQILFGGEAGDWLVIYSAYEGQGYRFRSGVAPENFSNLLGVRIMQGGFKGRIISTTDGWFLNGEDRLVLLKIFTDLNKDKIIGILDFTDELGGHTGLEVRSAKLLEPSKYPTLVLGDSLGIEHFFQLNAEGFKNNDNKFKIISKNLNSHNSEVLQARVKRLDVSPQDSKFSLFFANTENDWFPANLGEWINLPEGGKELFWKLEFSSSNPLFLDLIQIEYRIKNL
jgi:hypothetical protein